MAIAKRCADMLGHPVDLRSRPGHGTMFAITVPFGRPEETADTDTEIVVESTLGGLTTLCIDNDTDILEGMEHLLGAWGCEVATASDGAAASARFAQQTPSIILADYHLNAGESGLDVVIDLNKDRRQAIPAIVISADDSAQVRSKVRSAGFKFMAKPVNPGRLRAMIRALVDSSKL